MNNDDAKILIKKEIERYQALGYEGLRYLLKNVDAYEIVSSAGVRYQIEAHAVWDDITNGNLRIFIEISDGGLRTFIFPMTECILMTPEGIILD